MDSTLNEDTVQEALATCDSEPVHIPGIIQPIGHLLACDRETGVIAYASAEAGSLVGISTSELMGQTIADQLGPDIWHSCKNVQAQMDIEERRQFVGIWQGNGSAWTVHATLGSGHLILELEDTTQAAMPSPDIRRVQTQLVSQIQKCTDEAGLFRLTAQLLRHTTGFDRVMIYRFDAFGHGQVLAEERRSTLQSFEGLHFPKWDIPQQARAIMARVPLRLISDVDQIGVPVLKARPDLPDLDMSLAELRGVSEVHMQYLRNMGTSGSMTLSVVLDGELWGIISFHNTRPKVCPPEIRQLLSEAFLPVFTLKLAQIRDRGSLKLAQRINILQTGIQEKLENKIEIERILDSLGTELCDALNIVGLTIIAGSRIHSYGQTPSDGTVTELVRSQPSTPGTVYATDKLRDDFPQLKDGFGQLGGALVVYGPHERSLVFFRPMIEQSVAWAGNPEKDIEEVDGNARLHPRGSFSTYLQSIDGQAEPWSPQDQHLAQLLWPLLNAAERQAFMNDLSRQQMLMIGELNHRVRNILALIESVSRQARRSNSSLGSYSKALEARIRALAAAHDLGAGSAMPWVSVRKMIELENTPYLDEGDRRVTVKGPDFHIRADLAPTFALVIHELMTNAVKYGALSNSTGRIAVDLAEADGGLDMSWVETGGPPVYKPNSVGFGTMLITQAVGHEMGGTSDLDYALTGVKAHLTLPAKMLDMNPQTDDQNGAIGGGTVHAIPIEHRNGIILILEDNFVIATGMAEVMKSIGFPNSEVLAQADDALAYVETTPPAFAVLDINLGGGQTSFEVARALAKRNVPFVFVSGYGELADLPADLENRQVLTKPASQDSLITALAKIVG